MIKYTATTALLFCWISVFSQVEKIDTDRPDQTESAFTVPRKWVQFELGFTRQKNEPGATSFDQPTLLSKYGVNKRFEFRLITAFCKDEQQDPVIGKQSTAGLDMVQIGGKLALWEEKKCIPKTSLIFHVGIPRMASPAFRVNHLAPNFRFTMQNSLTEAVAIGYNLGAEWDGIHKEATWIYTFAPGFNLGPNWYAYVEAFGSVSKISEPEHSVDGGIAYYITSNLKIDFSAGKGISRAAPAWYLAAGCSFRFKAFR